VPPDQHVLGAAEHLDTTCDRGAGELELHAIEAPQKPEVRGRRVGGIERALSGIRAGGE
jgi:hypothetical protein